MKNDSNKKRVLIVAYDYPPVASIAALRISKFTKYLPQFGWEPIVLTGKIRKGQSQPPYLEASKVNTFRIDTGKLGKLAGTLSLLSGLTFFQTWRPEHAGWYYAAVKEGLKILSRSSVDVIFSSFPPPVPHFVASTLQQKTQIPWVAEFRDPWSFSPYTHHNRFTKTITRLIEKRTMKRSYLLVATSQGSERELRAFHSKEVRLIHNGFDEEDYQDYVSLIPKFTITYTGNIYRGKRNPNVLFEAVRQLWQEGILQPDDFRIRFFGSNVIRNITPLVIEFGVQDFVEVNGNIPFKECIRRQKESTVLLLLSWDNINDTNTLPGKVFEYIGAQRPILAIAYRSGEVDRLLQRSGTGVLANNVVAMKAVLSQWFKEWQRSGKIDSHWKPNGDAINKYTRKESARKLAQILDRAVK